MGVFAHLRIFNPISHLLHVISCPTQAYLELEVGKGTKELVCVAFAVPLVT